VRRPRGRGRGTAQGPGADAHPHHRRRPHSTLWFGEDPSQLGTSRADVEALGATSPQEGPLLTVLLRAALATGADVQLVPHQSEQSPQSGLGALLRYADSDV
jgi:hypothetical protein